MRVRFATLEDKPEIIRISKQSKHTRGVSNPMFMPDKAFEVGEVGVAEHKGRIVGFVAVHHLVRKPYTSLHYVGVDESARGKGAGERIVRWVMRQSPHDHIRLICDKTNHEAHKFYKKLGFRQTGEGANKAGEEYYVWEVTAEELRPAKVER